MHLFLVHHGDAVPPEVDTRRPLSSRGRAQVERLALEATRRGVHPEVIWHSGKLRARQTAEAFLRVCNPFAEFSATHGLQPGDGPNWIRDRLRGESRDVLIAGHFPHLPAVLAALLGTASADAERRTGAEGGAGNERGADAGGRGGGNERGRDAERGTSNERGVDAERGMDAQGRGDIERPTSFPQHGLVALVSSDEGDTWRWEWELEAPPSL